MSVDLQDPVTLRFVQRLVELTPNEWASIDRRLVARAAAYGATDEMRRNEELAQRSADILADLGLAPSPRLVTGLFRVMQSVFRRAALGTLGPGWRRRGAGPIRLLAEVLDRPYVSDHARQITPIVITMIRLRTRAPEKLRELYEPFEPVIP